MAQTALKHQSNNDEILLNLLSTKYKFENIKKISEKINNMIIPTKICNSTPDWLNISLKELNSLYSKGEIRLDLVNDVYYRDIIIAQMKKLNNEISNLNNKNFNKILIDEHRNVIESNLIAIKEICDKTISILTHLIEIETPSQNPQKKDNHHLKVVDNNYSKPTKKRGFSFFFRKK